MAITNLDALTLDGTLIANAGVREPVQTLTASGAVLASTRTLVLSHASVIIAATLPAPVAGEDIVLYDGSASGTAAHTVTCPAGVTFNVAGNNTATLNAPEECLHIRGISATRYCIVANTGAVGLSTV